MEREEIRERVAEARASGRSLEIRGSGSKRGLGRLPHGETFDVSAHAGIVDYDPSELVVTARCGTTIDELQRTLAAEGQALPFEPPRFGPGATVGGTVATGVSGPRRPWAGSVRDFVLGTVCVTGHAEVLSFGGRVMKNVAGYDASRLMVAAYGTLGIVLEVSFKVLPMARVEQTRILEMDAARAIDTLAELGSTPLPLSASCHYDDRLYLRLSGSEAGVARGADLIGGEPLAGDAAFWESIREQTHEFFAGDGELWRMSVPPAAAHNYTAGPVLTEWGGALRWVRGPVDGDRIRELAREAGGSASLFRNGDRTGEVFPELDPVSRRLHQHLKESFDPDRVLNPGRLYHDL